MVKSKDNPLNVLVMLFIAFILVQAFSESMPGFARFGWAYYSALVAGAGYWVKYTYFNK